MDWDRDFLERSPMLEPLRLHAAQLCTYADWPSRNDLGGLLAARDVRAASGAALRVVEPSGAPQSYESRVHGAGELQHRERQWHDFFNVLAWLAYPRTKAALNALHVSDTGGGEATPRSRIRDALTLFDESGAIVVSADPTLLEDLREFRWKRLFWERREHFEAAVRVYVFGHATFEKALAPYVGMTAHALLVDVDEAFIASPYGAQVAAVDALAARRIAAVKSPRELSPLPLLGVPGWWADNAREDFYDNEDYFRRGRASERFGIASSGRSSQ